MIKKEIEVSALDGSEQELSQAPDGFFLKVSVDDLLERSTNNSILDMVCKKVRKGGTLILVGVDGLHICSLVARGDISLKDASVFFGTTQRLNSIISLKDHFITLGWEIIFTGLSSDSKYVVEVVRK